VQLPHFGKVAISAGGSLGHGTGGTAGGGELTLKTGYFGPSFSLGLTGVGGSYLYLEASHYYWLSAGLGVGYRLSPRRRGAAISPFLGLPIPLALPAYSRSLRISSRTCGHNSPSRERTKSSLECFSR